MTSFPLLLVPTLNRYSPLICSSGPNCFRAIAVRLPLLLGIVVSAGLLTGCHDGPLYALKVVNPYYAVSDWKKDSERGVTDHQRRMELTTLAESIATMPAERQQTWVSHLDAMLENDESPEMRRLAVQTAGNLTAVPSISLIKKGLDDDSVKVRMEACRALASASVVQSDQSDDAARMLASTIGTETNEDVRRAAISALSSHTSPVAIDSLKVALRDRNPATQTLVVDALRGATGKNYGDDPQVWIAALDGKPTEQAETRIADRAADLLR